MNDNTQRIFEILNLKPNEEFEAYYYKEEDYIRTTYKIDDNLTVWLKGKQLGWYDTAITIADFLNGKYIIIKPERTTFWTKEEKLIAHYWKLMGFTWIAKDSYNNIWAYKSKPKKFKHIWMDEECCDFYKILSDMPNIEWEDEEPVNIEDILKES